MIEFSGNIMITAQATKSNGYFGRNISAKNIPFVGNQEMKIIKTEITICTFKICF